VRFSLRFDAIGYLVNSIQASSALRLWSCNLKKSYCSNRSRTYICLCQS